MTEAREALRDKILRERANGNVVIMGLDGLMIGPVSKFIEQPADGILYDLNRLEEVALSRLDTDVQWVNNFAVALVIRELKAQLEAALDAAEKPHVAS